jgi:hypothetical protein
MAIRNDFAPGETLLAADLNDTFGSKVDYPSGGSDGNVLTKSGTTAAWSAPQEAGLTLISSDTFSAVSSVSVSGCFSATYDNYLIMLTGVQGSSASTIINMRMRSGSTDATGSDYSRQFILGNGSGISGNRTTTTNFEAISRSTTSDVNYAKIEIFDPFRAIITKAVACDSEGLNGGSIRLFLATHDHNVATSYDGFTLFPAAGTFGGTVKVYGYRK